MTENTTEAKATDGPGEPPQDRWCLKSFSAEGWEGLEFDAPVSVGRAILLFGPNSSGKSSFTRLLLLVASMTRHCYWTEDEFGEPHLNDERPDPSPGEGIRFGAWGMPRRFAALDLRPFEYQSNTMASTLQEWLAYFKRAEYEQFRHVAKGRLRLPVTGIFKDEDSLLPWTTSSHPFSITLYLTHPIGGSLEVSVDYELREDGLLGPVRYRADLDGECGSVRWALLMGPSDRYSDMSDDYIEHNRQEDQSHLKLSILVYGHASIESGRFDMSRAMVLADLLKPRGGLEWSRDAYLMPLYFEITDEGPSLSDEELGRPFVLKGPVRFSSASGVQHQAIIEDDNPYKDIDIDEAVMHGVMRTAQIAPLLGALDQIVPRIALPLVTASGKRDSYYGDSGSWLELRKLTVGWLDALGRAYRHKTTIFGYQPFVKSVEADGELIKSLRFRTPDADGIDYRPEDVGRGILWVLATLKRVVDDGTRILEHIEHYLHPKAAAELAEEIIRHTPFVVLETHSEAILYRLQRLVAEGVVLRDNARVITFSRHYDGGEKRFFNRVRPIPMEENGDLSFPFPDGFAEIYWSEREAPRASEDEA